MLEIDFPSLIRFSSWFIPIPFMLLYHIKTKKLNFIPSFIPILLTIVTVIGVNIFSILFGYDSLGFTSDLLTYYVIILCISYLLFRFKYDFPQAISIAVCLTFFASLYWEIPYHIFVTLNRGYLDMATPLHLLYAFPVVYIWSKIQLKKDFFNISLVTISLGFSTLLMAFLLDLGVDFVWTYSNSIDLKILTEIVWMLSRFVCFLSLYTIFYRGTIRKKIKNQKS